MTQNNLSATAGIDTISLAQSIARRAVPVGCILGLAVGSSSAIAQDPGSRLGDEFRVNTETLLPRREAAIAMDADGDFVVTWESYTQGGDQYEIFAQRYSADGSAVGTEFRVNTETSSGQSAAAIAMDADGDFVVVWQSFVQDGSNYGIFAQRYNADGSAAGTEFQVNTETSDRQVNPAVAMDADGDFVIAWESRYQDGDNFGIFAQRYNADGSRAGTEFQVNTGVTFDQRFPAIAMDADGDFVVAWESDLRGDRDDGVFAQRYNADGSTAGTEFLVNTETLFDQSTPTIAMDADGDFVVAWQSYAQDGDEFGIFAQRYTADGSAAGTEFQVNTETSIDQRNPTIDMDATGDFVVAWQSLDGSGNGVYAQRYNADGTTVGAEFQVNTETSSSQDTAAIALDADGDFVVAWESYGQDGNEYSIFAQRFVGPEDVDLAVTVTDAPDPAEVGQTLTYTVMLDNQHDAVAPTGVTAIDSAIGSATGVTGLAELTGLDFTFQGVTTTSDIGITCTPFDGPPAGVDCSLDGPLPAGTSLNAELQVVPNETGTLTATASVTGNQFDSNEVVSANQISNGQTANSIAVTPSNNNDSEDTVVNEASPDTPPASSGGGSGGCALDSTPGTADPSLPILGLLAGLALYRRRIVGWLKQALATRA